VVAAGPTMNFIFAILAFALVLLLVGRDMTDRASLSPRIDGVLEGSAAEQAGLRAGDLITGIEGQAIRNFGEMQAVVSVNAGNPLDITILRNDQQLDLVVTPQGADVPDATGVSTRRGFLGIERQTLPSERVTQRFGPGEAIVEGAKQTWSIVEMTGAYVGNIFMGKASAEHIAGPAGIFNESGRIAQNAVAQEGVGIGERMSDLLLSLLQWAAILSVAVGIVNLLPIPVLDGGHLLFYAIEAVRGGKPLPPNAQEWALRAGLAMLGGLFLFATWNDIQRIWG
ncbi:MAG: RIP metalloprotease, partial [Hyphomonadaceae bacterium]